MKKEKTKNFLKLRGAVAAKGHTLTELALHLGITQQALNEKLHGRKQFNLAEIIKTCNFLEAPVDIFFDPELHNLQFMDMKKAQ
ncbi:helix-turn-helix transcriptional regulator [bacterium]|nr:MAG: helix-turn-helix transcriptional regulator [bacterium]